MPRKRPADPGNSRKFTLGIPNGHFGMIFLGGWEWPKLICWAQRSNSGSKTKECACIFSCWDGNSETDSGRPGFTWNYIKTVRVSQVMISGRMVLQQADGERTRREERDWNNWMIHLTNTKTPICKQNIRWHEIEEEPPKWQQNFWQYNLQSFQIWLSWKFPDETAFFDDISWNVSLPDPLQNAIFVDIVVSASLIERRAMPRSHPDFRENDNPNNKKLEDGWVHKEHPMIKIHNTSLVTCRLGHKARNPRENKVTKK